MRKRILCPTKGIQNVSGVLSENVLKVTENRAVRAGVVQVESSSRSSSLGSAGKDSSDPLTDRQVDQKQADTSLHLCPLSPLTVQAA